MGSVNDDNLTISYKQLVKVLRMHGFTKSKARDLAGIAQRLSYDGPPHKQQFGTVKISGGRLTDGDGIVFSWDETGMARLDTTPAGRCIESIAPIGGGALIHCALQSGHAGMHRSPENTEWTP
jgi:hypothetical protein